MSSNKRRRLATYTRKRNTQPQQSRLREVQNMAFFPNSNDIDLSQPRPPQQPRNQNEAMAMATQASEENIETVKMFTGCDGDTATRYLKVRNNDVDRAVNSILDGEDISKEEKAGGWDDSMFSMDRDGNASGERGLRPLGASAAPTRGPSPAGSARAPANKSEEDDELAKAIAMSQQESGILPPLQETGVVSGDGSSRSFVGPLVSDKHYKDSDWALVRTTHEIVPDVDVQDRVNKEDEPRFLKHTPNGNYLPNFLTICHAIPSAREALLLRRYLMQYYGDSDDWWRGNGIALPKIVHTESGTPVDSEIDKYDDFIAETQRLMAFLDGSKRSYASVDGLVRTEMLRSSSQSGLVDKFIKQFVEAAEARAGLRGETMSLFATNVGTTHPDGVSTPYMYVVELPVDTSEKDTTKPTLPELLDQLLWETEGDSVAQTDNFIQQTADVVVMHARQRRDGTGPLRIDVPASLYLDKYLETNVEISRGVRLQIAQQKQQVRKLEAIEGKLRNWKHPTRNEQIQSKDLLTHTLGHFSGKAGTEATTDGTQATNGITEHDHPHPADVARKLESIIKSVDQKLSKLVAEKSRILDSISKLSSSTPPELEARGLTDHYTLMGVATKPNITYVLRPSDEDEEEESDDSLPDAGSSKPQDVDTDPDTTPDGMKWWRIEYSTAASSGPSILKNKVPDYDVLRAVELEHSSALLVYASDRAADIANFNPRLPEPLAHFLREDNEHFDREIRDSASRAAPPAYNFDGGGHVEDVDAEQPRQSIEGRTSFDSMRAQRSSPELDGETLPDLIHEPAYDDMDAFDQHPGFGLGPSFSQGGKGNEDQVAEIRLSPPAEEREGEMEMVGGTGLKSVFSAPPKASEARIEDAGSQDDGVGGGGK